MIMAKGLAASVGGTAGHNYRQEGEVEQEVRLFVLLKRI